MTIYLFMITEYSMLLIYGNNDQLSYLTIMCVDGYN